MVSALTRRAPLASRSLRLSAAGAASGRRVPAASAFTTRFPSFIGLRAGPRQIPQLDRPIAQRRRRPAPQLIQERAVTRGPARGQAVEHLTASAAGVAG